MLRPEWIFDGSEIPDPFGYGERAVAWLRKLKHPKNPAPGHPFELHPWQERIIRRIYGPRYEKDVVDPDTGILVERKGARIVRRVVLLLPRGNRKTSLCAAITLLHLLGPEREPGNLIVSAASAHEQALQLYNEAASVVVSDKRMTSHLKLSDYKSTISFPKNRGRYVAIASDGKVQHGKTPNLVIADELHAWEGSAGQKQWEALSSALVKVSGTLMIVATTAGRGQDNLAWKQIETAMKIQRGEIHDPKTLPVIFAADKGDDWRKKDVWIATNPGMIHGYPVYSEYVDKAAQAEYSPSVRDEFLQYNLNVWLDQSTSPFVDMDVYDRGNGPVDLDAMKGEPCWIGVDLSSNDDLTAVVACWRDPGDEESYVVHPWIFVPRDNLERKEQKSNMPYVRWAEEGHIIATCGNVVDFREVEATIRDLCDRFDVREIAFDPHLGRNMMANLFEDGLPAREMRQGWVTMSPAIKELERAIISGKFRHGGHPVLRWNFANIALETDKAGNMTFNKGKSQGKIDAAQATAMAVGRAFMGEGARYHGSMII